MKKIALLIATLAAVLGSFAAASSGASGAVNAGSSWHITDVGVLN